MRGIVFEVCRLDAEEAQTDLATVGTIEPVEKVVRVFKSYEEAEEADREYYRSLTPEQRLEILFLLIERWNGTGQRLTRVRRATKLKRG
jgi:hypothetical protein